MVVNDDDGRLTPRGVREQARSYQAEFRQETS
jgi:hypothetical protein